MRTRPFLLLVLVLAPVSAAADEARDKRIKDYVAKCEAEKPKLIAKAEATVKELRQNLNLAKRAKINPNSRETVHGNGYMTFPTKESRQQAIKDYETTYSLAKAHVAKLKGGEFVHGQMKELLSIGDIGLAPPGITVQRVMDDQNMLVSIFYEFGDDVVVGLPRDTRSYTTWVNSPLKNPNRRLRFGGRILGGNWEAEHVDGTADCKAAAGFVRHA